VSQNNQKKQKPKYKSPNRAEHPQPAKIIQISGNQRSEPQSKVQKLTFPLE